MKCAELRVAGLSARRGRELGLEARPEPVRLQRQLEQPVLPECGLADGRQHSRGDVRGAGSGPIALEHEHPQAAFGRAPRARETDDAGADDDHVVLVGV